MDAVTTSLVSDKKVSDKKNSDANAYELNQQASSISPSNSHTDNNAAALLPEGTVLLNRYMLMRVIAQGGASCIYRARDMLAVLGGNEHQSHIAVKIICNDAENISDNHQLVLHEALTTRHLSHPNILKVFDYHRDGDISFVTMELVDGESLAQYIQRSPNKKLPYRFAISILKAVAAALQSAHEQGVVHSDVKPSNILKTEMGQIKVIDFATARTIIEQNNQSANNKKQSSESASFYGYTLAYASPETIQDKPATASDDVFSFACIAYEVLAGKHPYGRKPTNTIDKNFRLIKPREVGFWQWQVLKRGLALDGSQRTASIKRFIGLFHHARYLWSYLICLLVFLVGSGMLASWAFNGLKTENADSLKHETFYRQEQHFQSTLESLKKMDPVTQLSELKSLTDVSFSQKANALSVLKEGIVSALSERVEETIAAVEPLNAATEFDELTMLLTDAQTIYPDSLLLAKSLESVTTELSQLRDTSQFALAQAWMKTDFSQQSASEIQAAMTLLQRSDNHLVNQSLEIIPERAIVEQYQSLVLEAVDNLDVVSVSQLFEFSLAFENIQEFRNVWRAIDKGYVIGAQEWMDFAVSERNHQDYPQLTMKFFVTPYFNDLDKRISTVWTDKDLVLLKDELFAGIDQYSLAATMDIVRKTNSNLTEKVKNKIQYYKNKSNRRGVNSLNTLLAELASEHRTK